MKNEFDLHEDDNQKSKAFVDSLVRLTDYVDNQYESIQTDENVESFDGMIRIYDNMLSHGQEAVRELDGDLVSEFLNGAIYESIGMVAIATQGYPMALIDNPETLTVEDRELLVESERKWVSKLYRQNGGKSPEELTRIFYRELGKRVAPNYLVPGVVLMENSPADELLGENTDEEDTIRTGYSPFMNSIGVSLRDLSTIKTDKDLAKAQNCILRKFHKYVLRCNFNYQAITDDNGQSYVRVGEHIHMYGDDSADVENINSAVNEIASRKGQSTLSVLTKPGISSVISPAEDQDAFGYDVQDDFGLPIDYDQPDDQNLEAFERFFNGGQVLSEEANEVLNYLMKTVAKAPEMMADTMKQAGALIEGSARLSGYRMSAPDEQRFFYALRLSTPAPFMMQIKSRKTTALIERASPEKTKIAICDESAVKTNSTITSVAQIFPQANLPQAVVETLLGQHPYQPLFERLAIIEPAFLQIVLRGVYSHKYDSVTEGIEALVELAKKQPRDKNNDALKSCQILLKQYRQAIEILEEHRRASQLPDLKNAGGVHYRYFIDSLESEIELTIQQMGSSR